MVASYQLCNLIRQAFRRYDDAETQIQNILHNMLLLADIALERIVVVYVAAARYMRSKSVQEVQTILMSTSISG